MRHHVELGEDGGMLQVAVGDVAMRIFHGHEGCLHVGREGHAPVVSVAAVVEVDTAHASAGGVRSTEEGWQLGHQLGQVSGTRAEAGSKAGEGIEVAANEGVQAHAVVAGFVLSPLQGTEQASGTGDGERHEA
jgi:hypothetical protein